MQQAGHCGRPIGMTLPPTPPCVRSWTGLCATAGRTAAAALALASLLSLFARHGWLLDALTFWRQHFLVAALLLTALALAARQRRLALVGLLCALVNLVPILMTREPGPGPISARAAASSGTQIRALSLNLLGENYHARPVLRLLRESGADVIALEEVGEFWAKELGKLADLYPYSAPPRPWRNSTVLLSRHPFVEAAKLRAPKGIVSSTWTEPVRALIDVAGTPVAVYAVHPETPRSPEQWRMRNGLLAWLAPTIRGLDAGRPRIVLGDFNTPPWSPFFRDLLAATDLHDAAGGGLRQPTRQPMLLAPHLAWLGAPVDHILVSPGLEPVSFRVGPDVRSDHLPVIADLRLLPPLPQPAAASPAR
jgi:endonuclease/exonuclease/phosphatase (EEP) superfamily protein YafD